MPETTTYALRHYEPADADACAGVFERAWNAGHPYTIRKVDTADFLRRTERESIIVAAGPGRILGLASVYTPDAFIHYLLVDPDSARRGVGSVLLRAAVDMAGGEATLKCQVWNQDALRFYRREGWTTGEAGITDNVPWVRMVSPRPPHGLSGLGVGPSDARGVR